MAQTDTPRRRTRQEKIDLLIKLIFQGHKSFTQIAREVGVSRRTAYRYWHRWKQTEEAQHVDWEWWALFNKVRDSKPEKALECLTRIKHRMTTEKVEENITVKEKKLQVNVNLEQLNSEAVGAITQNYLDHEARQLRQTNNPAIPGAADSTK